MLSINRRLLTLCTLVVFALSATFVIAQHEKDDHKMPAPGSPEAAKMQKEMEDKMMQAGMPGPEHKEMMKSAGDWDAQVKFLDMATGKWSEPTKGTMHMEPIMDGRYMQMTFEGSMMMNGQTMPFKGMGIMGYDNMKKKYFSTWIDSMSTMMMKSEGTKSGDTLTLMGSMPDGMGGESKTREVMKHADADHMSYEMYCDMMGKEMKMMEISYTRKK
ncbi:hypothetical protein BH09PLA1_BH09PLA1_04030 [soil metagenome]